MLAVSGGIACRLQLQLTIFQPHTCFTTEINTCLLTMTIVEVEKKTGILIAH